MPGGPLGGVALDELLQAREVGLELLLRVARHDRCEEARREHRVGRLDHCREARPSVRRLESLKDRAFEGIGDELDDEPARRVDLDELGLELDALAVILEDVAIAAALPRRSVGERLALSR